MSDPRIQLRGNCQCCGRFQAVTDGRLAHHGYTVEHGYFHGTCSGHQHAPLQTDRTVADRIVVQVRSEVEAHIARAEQYRAKGLPGKLLVPRPGVYVPRGKEPELVRADSLHGYDLQRATDEQLYRLDNAIRGGTSFANQLEELADKLHGTALEEVKVEPAPDRILRGDTRVSSSGSLLTASHTDRGRVYWKDANGRRGWTGSAAWRRMACVD